MKKNLAETLEDSAINELQIPTFGYELIREIVLDNILGQDSYQILYWTGKQLARKFPLSSMGEVVAFFQSAGWGDLIIEKETKNEMELTLTGEIINRRLELYSDCHFQLETGFLAEQSALQKKCSSEAVAEIKKRAKRVIFTVQWDPKDPL
ncbi:MULTISPECIES: YslB family protein [Peribacillus]|uniref:YslB family protein n=1 Tax=Peribacillus TaxID=2675229 RepID=UPI00207A9BE8|nr:YslB family protein [Peribacillus asahii]USK59019.1 YslB family protein [Peribacillus asahii]